MTTEQRITTPFGGGRMTAHAFLLQKGAAERQARLSVGEGGNATGRADKWALIAALTEARAHYGLSDRTIMLLEALTSFVPGRELDGRTALIVFPSNQSLSGRARGMAPATIRRHLGELVRLGFIFRRDSPNGKRYQRRDETGSAEAYGFDLAPLALRADEILAAAEATRAAARAERALRAEITLHQRDIAKLIEAALAEARPGPWLALAAEFASHAPRLRRRDAGDLLAARRTALLQLRARVEQAYLDSLSTAEMSASDAHFERHNQNSNEESSFEINGWESSEGEAGLADDRTSTVQAAGAADGTQARARESGSKSGSKRGGEGAAARVSLARLLKACPTIADYAPGGIASEAALVRTADLVRSMLGISPHAYTKAQAVLGRLAAAAVVAMMLERAEAIRSPGGYLRSLTDKADAGHFSLLPMLQALERAKG